MNLYEKHRPRDLAGVVGQAAAVRECREIIRRGVGGRGYFIAGPSGAGKSTLAHILAAEIADGDCIVEIAGDELTAERLREFQERSCLCGCIGSNKAGWCLIVNETHGIRADVIRRLLVIIGDRPVSAHVAYIFTTTTEGADLFGDKVDASPFLSRCVQVHLTSQGLCKAFAAHVREIATAEGLNGKPLADYERLAKDCRNNMRAMLQAVSAGQMREG